jgi:hypothetical protein
MYFVVYYYIKLYRLQSSLINILFIVMKLLINFVHDLLFKKYICIIMKNMFHSYIGKFIKIFMSVKNKKGEIWLKFIS